MGILVYNYKFTSLYNTEERQQKNTRKIYKKKQNSKKQKMVLSYTVHTKTNAHGKWTEMQRRFFSFNFSNHKNGDN